MVPSNVLHKMLSAPYLMTDPGDAGTITVDREFGVVPMVSAAAETRTLAQPTKAGLVVTLSLKTYAVGAITVTVTGGYNLANDATIIFNTTGDWVQFQSQINGTAYYWRVVASEGVALLGVENAFGGVTAGTVTASKALVVDANKALDDLKISKLKLAVATYAAGAANITTTVVASAGINVVGTVATDSGGVKLPALVAADVGEVVIVKNSGASACILYGNSASINGSATSDGFAVAATKTTVVVAIASNHWNTVPLAIA